MASENIPRKTYKLKPARVVFIYLVCVIVPMIAPLNSYISNGAVESSRLIIALLTLLTGVSVASIALWRLRTTGKFLHYELKDRH